MCAVSMPGQFAAREELESVMVSEYVVSGMSCEHCVSRVTAEVSQLAGVSEVQVDLSTGTVSVTSDRPLQQSAVESAIDEAGYELATA